MPRPITIFTGQWADLPLKTLAPKIKKCGYDGLELACWGDHFDVNKALSDSKYCANHLKFLKEKGLSVYAISNHLMGQAVCDLIDERHKQILPAEVWGDGKPAGVRARAAEEMIKTGQAAAKLGVKVVNGFTGSPIWHLLYSFPPVSDKMIHDGFKSFAKAWKPILDEYQKLGIRFALEVHPTEIAFDIVSAERAIEALDGHPAFGFNYDPSHLGYQGVDYLEFIYRFKDRIFHAHMKDVYWSSTPRLSGVFGGHLPFGDPRRFWEFRSVGRGCINFELVLRALNDIGYAGPLSVEWEDGAMDREHGATESCAYLRKLDFPRSNRAFDSAFSEG